MPSRSKCKEALKQIYTIAIESRDDDCEEIIHIVETVLDKEICEALYEERDARRAAAFEKRLEEVRSGRMEFVRALMEGGSIDEYGDPKANPTND